MNAVGVRIGQIIVRDVSEARLRTAFPSDPRPRCTEFLIWLVLGHQSHSAMLQRIGFARTAEPGTATRYWWPSAPVVTM
jgi:hypothetical protein